MRVAAHGRLIHADFLTTHFHQSHEFVADNRQQSFGEGVPVLILLVRHEPSAECVRAGNAGL